MTNTTAFCLGSITASFIILFLYLWMFIRAPKFTSHTEYEPTEEEKKMMRDVTKYVKKSGGGLDNLGVRYAIGIDFGTDDGTFVTMRCNHCGTLQSVKL